MNKETLHKIGYGMYVVSSKRDDKFNGQIANTVFQITSDPPAIAISINKKNLTHEYILYSKIFTVSILWKPTPLKFIGHFGFRTGRDFPKFENIKYKIGITGAPIVLDNCLGYLEAEVVNTMDAGTHTLFLGKVVNLDTISEEEPMTYKYYHDVKNGKVPETAPTYLKEESLKKKG